MSLVINVIVAVLMLVALGSSFGPIYRAVQRATVIRVHQGLEPLSPFTRRLISHSKVKHGVRSQAKR